MSAHPPESPQHYSESNFVLSYLALRRAVGIIGISLPAVLAFGDLLFVGIAPQATISAYYYTAMGDVFVGSLCAVAVFLLAYRGPGERDKLAGRLAGIGAIGVALFPVAPETNSANPELSLQQQLVDVAHAGFAALFFLSLAYFCLVLFRKTGTTTQPTAQKQQRNRVYWVCGVTIVISVFLIGLQHFILKSEVLGQLNMIFWLESLAIIAFGIAWFVKGEGLLKDRVV